LWTGLSRTLTLLERYAAEPAERLDTDDAPEVLSSLQYRLHVAGEVAAGIVPPPGSTMAHEELSSALADARDATAEVVEALELGSAADASPLVPEWRGALFRVRLARLRLTSTKAPEPAPGEAEDVSPRPALLATTCVLAGTLVFAVGATAALWPVWAAGFALFLTGCLVYRL
jgi:hypothetical protein